nr:glutamate-1-semialdehyde 2,1-aminomutase, chloroplastic [Quercus suber]
MFGFFFTEGPVYNFGDAKESDTAKFARQNGKQRRHGERNSERGRVPKAVHCALQSKGKERRVRLNHTAPVPLPNLDPQTAKPTLTTESNANLDEAMALAKKLQRLRTGVC